MKNIYTLFLLLFSIGLFSQTVTVSEDLSIRNDQGYFLLGKLKDRTLLFRHKTNDFEVQAFDEKLRLSWNKELELEKKRVKLLDVIPGREDFTVFYQFKHKSDYIIKANRYDPAANLIDSTTVINMGKGWYNPNINVALSEDKRSILFYHFERQTHLIAYSFDIDGMELRWKKQITPPDLNQYRDYQDLLISNTGRMYFIMGKNNRRFKKEDHYYDIYESDGYGINNFKVSMGEYLTYDIRFAYDNLNKNLVAAGFYSNKSRAKAEGYFYFQISPNSPDSKVASFEPFELEFVATIRGKKNTTDANLDEIDVQDVILRRDGGVLLVGEKNKIFERRFSGAGSSYAGRDGGSRYIVDYYFDDIFVISLHPDGRTHWKNILHKKQYSQDDDAIYSSYFLLRTPSNIRFLFNDEIRSENTVSEYVVNGKGHTDRNSLLSTQDQDIRLRFRDAMQVASNELVIPSERRHRLKLVRVQY